MKSSAAHLYPAGLSGYDVEIIQTIAMLFGGGDLPLRKMHISDRSIDSYTDQHGAPDVISTGFTFPAYRWRVPGNRRRLVVIDQGAKRIEFMSIAMML